VRSAELKKQPRHEIETQVAPFEAAVVKNQATYGRSDVFDPDALQAGAA